MLQCVAVRCSVLQCVAVCCSVLHLHFCAEAFDVDYEIARQLQCVTVFQCDVMCWSVLECVGVCCSVLQCVAVCCTCVFVLKRLVLMMR